MERLQQRDRLVLAAIVDADHFPSPPGLLKNRQQAGKKTRQIELFVKYRYDDGKGR
jgi:hypothetical protein